METPQRQTITAIACAFAAGAAAFAVFERLARRGSGSGVPCDADRPPAPFTEKPAASASALLSAEGPFVARAIGNTPLVRINSLSSLLGVEVLAKAEYINPGGSSKDRVALQIIQDAVAEGRLRRGGWVVEGSSGSTGISLALLSRALGYRCYIAMPDDQAAEKQAMLRTLGAVVHLVKPAAITHKDHYVNVARRAAAHLGAGGTPESFAAAEAGSGSSSCGSAGVTGATTGAGAMPDGAACAGAVYCDQFETPSNVKAHYSVTGPELWAQAKAVPRQGGGGGGLPLDAFVMGAGTGGTLAGIARYLKEAAAASAAPSSPRVVLVDPPGSSLYNRVAHGVCFAPQQAERGLRRHRYDTIIEGVGADRITANFGAGLPYLDAAVRCSDQEAVYMSRFMLSTEGLFIGSSAAMNLVGVVKAVRGGLVVGHGSTRIVTILCDHGGRHMSRLWNPAYLATRGLSGDFPTPPQGVDDPLWFVGAP